MIRQIVRVLVLCVLVTVSNRAFAYDPASVYPENGFLFARAVVKDLVPQGDNWSKDLPEFGRIFDKTTKLITEKIGFHPLRDIHEIGLFITSDVDFSIKKPNHVAFFLRGTFQPERLMTVLPELLAGMGPKARQVTVKDVQGRKIISAPEFSAYFADNETLIAGTPDIMEDLISGKVTLGKVPEALKATVATSRFFLSADAKTLKEKSPKIKRDLERVPPSVKVHLESLQQLVLAYTDGRATIKADFNKAESAAFVASSLDAMRNQGLLECESRLKSLEDGLEQMSAAELIGDKRGRMLALAAGKDLISQLTSKASGNSFEATFLIPEPVRSCGAGPAMLPMIGVLSAIAIPNFKKARSNAQMAACYANIRILTAAVEMYNMDHPQQAISKLSDADGLEGGILLKGKYLSAPIQKADPECAYESSGDLTTGGKIRCRKHGSPY